MAKKYKDFLKEEFTNPINVLTNFGLPSISGLGATTIYCLNSGPYPDTAKAISTGFVAVSGLILSFTKASVRLESYNAPRIIKHSLLKDFRENKIPYSKAKKAIYPL